MANFPPLKNYILYCLDRLCKDYGLQAPFLDIGCGVGDVSLHLGRKGWEGQAIDLSAQAVEAAGRNLREVPAVSVAQYPVEQITSRFNTILMMDIIEHVEDDERLLSAASERLHEGGHIIISVPSNPREWRWDDDFYGHVRRYTVASLKERLCRAGLEPLVFWDFTFPSFWLMRRLYTRLKKPPLENEGTALEKTLQSSRRNAWDVPLLSRALSATSFLWRPVYFLQFHLCRKAVEAGHEMIVLARKRPLGPA